MLPCHYAKDSKTGRYRRKGEQPTIEKIRANTLTGRPFGSDSFVTGLEKRFGVRLRPLPEGRPKVKDTKTRGAKRKGNN